MCNGKFGNIAPPCMRSVDIWAHNLHFDWALVVIKEEEDVRFDAPDLSMSSALDEQQSNDEEDGVADPDFVDPNNSDDDLNMAEMEQELVELNESEEESSDDDGSPRRKGKAKKGKSKGKKRGRKETIAEPIS